MKKVTLNSREAFSWRWRGQNAGVGLLREIRITG